MRRKTPAAVPRPGEGKRGPEGHLGYLVRQANVGGAGGHGEGRWPISMSRRRNSRC